MSVCGYGREVKSGGKSAVDHRNIVRRGGFRVEDGNARRLRCPPCASPGSWRRLDAARATRTDDRGGARLWGPQQRARSADARDERARANVRRCKGPPPLVGVQEVEVALILSRQGGDWSAVSLSFARSARVRRHSACCTCQPGRCPV